MPGATLLVLAIAFGMLVPQPLTVADSAVDRHATPVTSCSTMSEAENREIVQHYYDAVSAFDLDALDDVLAPVVVQHAADVADGVGIEQVKANIGLFLAAFPDLTHEIEQWVTDGDFVAARVVQSGTHEEDFLGIPATGQKATWTVIGIWRIECGKIAEQWVEVDQISRLQQLGAFPVLDRAAGTPSAAGGNLSSPATPAGECPTTSEEQNAELVSRWYDEVWTQGNFDDFAEFLAPDHVHHRTMNRLTTGAGAREETARAWRSAFPDLATTPEVLLTDGDRVVARWIASGTHEGPWQGIAPTGTTMTMTGNTIFRVECGRIAKEWSEASMLALFQQLGVEAGPPAPLPEATQAP